MVNLSLKLISFRREHRVGNCPGGTMIGFNELFEPFRGGAAEGKGFLPMGKCQIEISAAGSPFRYGMGVDDQRPVQLQKGRNGESSGPFFDGAAEEMVLTSCVYDLGVVPESPDCGDCFQGDQTMAVPLLYQNFIIHGEGERFGVVAAFFLGRVPPIFHEAFARPPARSPRSIGFSR